MVKHRLQKRIGFALVNKNRYDRQSTLGILVYEVRLHRSVVSMYFLLARPVEMDLHEIVAIAPERETSAARRGAHLKGVARICDSQRNRLVSKLDRRERSPAVSAVNASHAAGIQMCRPDNPFMVHTLPKLPRSGLRP